jgi:thermitase
VLVKLKTPNVLGRLATRGRSAAEAAGALRADDVVPAAKVQRLVVPAARLEAALAELRERPDVAFAEPERPMRAVAAGAGPGALLVPDDPRFAEQWAAAKIRAPEAWALATGGAPLTVAVVDTGIQLDHPDLAARLVAGTCTATAPDELSQDPCAGAAGQGSDGHGHGTHVAGIIAAAANNGTGVAGVAYGSAVKLMPVKVLRDDGTGYDGDVASGVRWAVDHGAKVINLSLGGPYSSVTLNEQIDYAYAHGVLVVASAGNCGDASAALKAECSFSVDAPDYPAAYAAAQPERLIPSPPPTRPTPGRRSRPVATTCGWPA